jgi:hypothetical protein
MELIILLVVAISCFVFGWYAREQAAIRTISRMLDAAEQQADEEPKNVAEKMVLEKHNETIYAYTVDGHEFIAQGASLEELDKAIQARFPGKKFTIREDNLKELALEYHESV